MKKFFYVLSLLAFCVLAIHSVHGQESGDAHKELSDLQSKSWQLRKVKSYRTKTTTEVFDEGGKTPKYKIEAVYESIPPDRNRYASTFVQNGVTKKFESISVGKKKYIKEDGKEWKLEDFEPEYGIGGGSLEYVKLVEETTFNGQPVKVYEEKGYSSSGTDSRNYIKKYWFTREGELLKTEEEAKNDENEILKIVTIYQFDPNIKIEAPIK